MPCLSFPEQIPFPPPAAMSLQHFLQAGRGAAGRTGAAHPGDPSEDALGSSGAYLAASKPWQRSEGAHQDCSIVYLRVLSTVAGAMRAWLSLH